jgi:hypothetical protein
LAEVEWQEELGYVISFVFTGTSSLYVNRVEPHLLRLKALTGKVRECFSASLRPSMKYTVIQPIAYLTWMKRASVLRKAKSLK